MSLSEPLPVGFPCPACGFLTFVEPPGSYDICRVCGWEDDHVQLAHPLLEGGANRESLVEAQIKALRKYPPGVKEAEGFRRDPLWRVPTEAEAAVRADAPRDGRSYFEAMVEEPGYYWREGSSGRAEPDAA